MFRQLVGVLVVLSAVTSGCASHAPLPVPLAEPRPTTVADSTRGHQLAESIVVGDTIPGVAVAPRMGVPDYRSGGNGSVAIAFIVEASGRVSLISRTVVIQSGETDFAKAACKWLTTATFVFKTRPPSPTFVIMPFIYFSPGQAKPPPFRELLLGLWAMSPADREHWLAAKPSCSEL